MKSEPVPNAASRPRQLQFSAVVVGGLVLALGSVAGCDELTARSQLQDATREYERGRYTEAVALCEDALKVLPDFETAVYNCGIIYHKLLTSGVQPDRTDELADRTASLFEAYLRKRSSDQEIVSLLTEVWMQYGKADRAIAFWEKELAKEPKDTEIMLILAGLTHKAGTWERSIYWYERIVEVEQGTGGKIEAYLNIAKVVSGQLFNRTSTVWGERLRVADIGIASLQKAKSIDPENADVETYLGVLYGLRGEAHQAAWAQFIDKSESRHHHLIAGDLRKEAEAEEAKNHGGAGTDPAPDESPDDGEPEGDPPEDDPPEGGPPEGDDTGDGE